MKLVTALVFALMNVSFFLQSETIAVIGTGYVGLVAGACLADFGNIVYCVDIDQVKIAKLQQGIIPIYEQLLPELVEKNREAQRLFFDTDIIGVIKKAHIIIIAAGTPALASGKADVSAIYSIANLIAEQIDDYKLICIKSTIPIGTSKKVKEIIQQKTTIPFDIVFNPEFLREGTAVTDFLNPSRIVIGVETVAAKEIIRKLYEPLLKKNIPLIETDFTSAEMIKYVANCFLALKIGFINEMSRISEYLNANIKDIACAVGLDPRIGKEFLKPGPGFGGSCFPKDLQEFICTAQEHGEPAPLLTACYASNEQQKKFIVDKIIKLLDHDLEYKTITILGLAFKAGTDDIRCSPALDIICRLQDQSKTITIKVHDPMAMKNAQKIYPTLHYCTSLQEAIEQTDLIVILTEWPEFVNLALCSKRSIKQVPILDCRNLLSEHCIASYHGIGINPEKRLP